MQMPTNARVIRTMCSGRISEDFVLRAFTNGAPTVLVSGCHLTDCHYINANQQTKKRVEKLWKRFDKWGIRTERLGLAWVSAAEGAKFQDTITRMTEIAGSVTKKEIKETQELIAKNYKFKAEKIGKSKAKAAHGGKKKAMAKNGT